MADPNPICFSFDMEGGGIFEGVVAYRQPYEIFLGRIIMASGIVLMWSYLSALKILFMEWLKKARFELSDFIIGFLPFLERNCVSLFGL